MMTVPPSAPDPSAGGPSQPDPYGRQSQQDPYGQQPSSDPFGQQPPYGHQAQPGQYGQQGQQDPYGQQPSSDPFGHQSRPDPYGRPPGYDQQAPGGPAAPAPGTVYTAPAPGTDLGSDLGAGLKFAGTTMIRNPVAYLLSGLVYGALTLGVILAGTVIAFLVTFAGADQWEGTSDEIPVGPLLLLYGIILASALVAVVLTFVWQSGAARSGAVVLEGGRPRFGQTMAGPVRVILTALLVGIMVLIGSLLLYIPGLILTVMTMYAIPAAIRGASPLAAVKESFGLASSHLGTTILVWLIAAVISAVASSVVIGILISIPFLVLFQLGMYERLSGRRLPEPLQG